MIARTDGAPDVVDVTGVSSEVLQIPPLVLADFVAQALRRIGSHSLNNTPRAVMRVEAMTGGQIGEITRLLGAEALEWADVTPAEVPLKKQDKWNRDYEQAGRVMAGTQGNDVLNRGEKKSHQEWLRDVDVYMEYALTEEATHGLDAAVDSFEAVRKQCLGARGTLPLSTIDGVPTEPGAMLLIKHAGCLARLSASAALRPYDTSEAMAHPDTVDRDRNDDLYTHALRLYREAKECLGEHATDEQRFLVDSGKAQALALRGDYLDKRYPQRVGSDSTVTVARSSEEQEAILVLESVQTRSITEEIACLVKMQIDDINQARLGRESLSDGSSPVASTVLHDLVVAA